MVNVWLGRDLTEVLRLKALLGLPRAAALQQEHPLFLGLQAAERELAGLQKLSAEENEALARVKMAAHVVFQNESHWRPVEPRFAADLRNSEECKSILFELHVITFAISPVAEGVEWRHYTHGSPDIAAQWPEMVIECKLVRSDKLFRIKSKLDKARRQHTGLMVPYVIAVGFDHGFTRKEIDDILPLAEGLKDWFRSFPDVSAGIIVTPANLAVPLKEPIPNPLRIRGSPVLHGAVTQIIHHAAHRPLTAGFSFNSGERLSVESKSAVLAGGAGGGAP